MHVSTLNVWSFQWSTNEHKHLHMASEAITVLGPHSCAPHTFCYVLFIGCTLRFAPQTDTESEAFCVESLDLIRNRSYLETLSLKIPVVVFKIVIFNYVCVYACVRSQEQIHEIQKKTLDSLVLKSQVVMIAWYRHWELNPGLMLEQYVSLTTEPPPSVCLMVWVLLKF